MNPMGCGKGQNDMFIFLILMMSMNPRMLGGTVDNTMLILLIFLMMSGGRF